MIDTLLWVLTALAILIAVVFVLLLIGAAIVLIMSTVSYVRKHFHD